ncbi:hypothetical protein LSH36_29g08008 [Paralvinella palmiformis]|uniref:Vesicular, overexpressed in cancer, prosurvival protein 1 n=1 Tax=Paralvinella palmiformis TaxID=53620 RepID=A0AAD9K9R0_9ANNE|nr:hypothetical protein LSH36_29g08008 [Paralvinella palmiformis]
MATKRICSLFFGVIYSLCTVCQTQEFCRSMNYWCKEGHCCGRGKCCTYYYELWWFWFVWLAIAVAGICCFYQKKTKNNQFTRRFFRRRVTEERVRNTETATNTEPSSDRRPLDPETNISSFTSSLPLPPCGPPVYSLPTGSQPEATALSTSDDLPPQYTSQPIRNQLSSNCALAESGKYVYWLYDM